MIRRLTLLVGLLLLVAALNSVAGERNVIIQLPPEPVTEFVAACGDYDVLTTFVGSQTLHLQFDKEGNLVKSKSHHRMDGRSTYYNSVDNEIAIQGKPEHLNVNIDFESGVVRISGVNFRVTLPGVGMIFQQGGHYTYNLVTGEYIHVGGPNDMWSGNIDALCAALAP